MWNQAEQQRQMRERAGPQYELATERARIATTEWNAKGRPAAVRSVLVPVTFTERDGQRYGVDYETRFYLARSMRRAGRPTSPDQWVEATPEQVEAWADWQRTRPTFTRPPAPPPPP